MAQQPNNSFDASHLPIEDKSDNNSSDEFDRTILNSLPDSLVNFADGETDSVRYCGFLVGIGTICKT